MDVKKEKSNEIYFDRNKELNLNLSLEKTEIEKMDGLKQNISPYTLQGIFTGKITGHNSSVGL